jgi:hypothetical protein
MYIRQSTRASAAQEKNTLGVSHLAFSKCIAACLSFLVLSMTGCSGCNKKDESPQAPESTRQANEETSGTEASESAPQENSSPDSRDAAADQASQAAAAGGGSIGSQGSTDSDSSDEDPSAAEARERARTSQRVAKGLASKGDVAKAFQEVLTSWQELQQFEDDPSSQALANELAKAMEEYGELLNERAAKNDAGAISRKPLTVE